MFDLLEKSITAFKDALEEDVPEMKSTGGSKLSKQLYKRLKITKQNSKQLTDVQELYLSKLLTTVDEGGLPKNTISSTLKALKSLGDEINDPRRVIAVVESSIPDNLLEDHYVENKPKSTGKNEVVLSMYLKDD